MAQSSTRSSAAAVAEANAPLADVFDGSRKERVDAERVLSALTSLLGTYPEAPVIALEKSGAAAPMPASIPLVRNPVLDAPNGLDVVAQQDRVRLLASWDRVLAVGAAQCPIHLADRAESAVRVCGFDLRDSHGVIVAVFVPDDEGTGGAPAVVELAPGKPRFATIRTDENSFIVGITESVTELLGWSEEEMKGHRSLEFLHPDDHPLAIDNWMQMIVTQGPARRVRLRHRRRDGDWVWFEVTNHNLLHDPAYGCVVREMVDISEEMAAQEEIRAHQQVLAQLAEAVPLGLFKLNADRHVVYTNPRLHEIVGVGQASDVRELLANLTPSAWELVDQALEGVLRDGRPADIEIQLQSSRNRKPRCCAVNLRALTNSDGTVSGAIACVADVTENVDMREELKRLATYDELTGCYNRPSIMRALEAELANDDRKGELAVMFIDLDEFKEVNDRYGHATGDRLLSIVAKRLNDSLREGDLVGRIGGDEFLVVCPEIGGQTQLARLAKRLASTLEGKVRAGRITLHPQVSIGIAYAHGTTVDADTLVAEADGMMYEAKRKRAGNGEQPEAVHRPHRVRGAHSSTTKRAS